MIPVFFLHSQQEAVRHWALCSFRRPNRLCQDRVDLPERRLPQSSLPVLARRASADPERRLDVDFRKLSTARRILIDALRHGSTSCSRRDFTQSRCEARASASSTLSEPDVSHSRSVRCRHRAAIAARLARSLLDPPLNAKLDRSGPAPWYRKLNEALVALDGYQAGASQREIAAVLYGRARAEAAWRNGDFSFKQRVHRAVAKGRALSAGGYVALLR